MIHMKRGLATAALAFAGLAGLIAPTVPGAAVVGYLEQGGAANWFVTEMRGGTFRAGAAENYWWGSTMADNGRWGWVPEVYFAGGENNEDDAGLLMPGGYTCANTCPPLPFWAR
jgi:hypothetical protein